MGMRPPSATSQCSLNSPVLPMSVTALLHAQTAVLRQAGEHFLECHVLLALQAWAAFFGLGAFMRALTEALPPKHFRNFVF